MHVALIIDQERLTQEQSMLNRLCIGLMSEGVQVTRIVPDAMPAESLGEGEQRVALAARIDAPMKVLPWMRKPRVHRIEEILEKSLPHVLYAVGEDSWKLGGDLAQVIDRPLVLDVCSMHQMKVVLKPSDSPHIAGYIAPCAAIAQTLGQRVDRSLISHIPMGVALPPQTRRILADADNAVALAVLGGGHDLSAYDALLRSLGGVIKAVPNVQVFLELRGPHEHEIWRKAQRLDLLGLVSAIGEASLYRSLLTRCDLLLMPERMGELRSIMLEAMALGMPVVASQDPALDMLVDGQTARLVMKPHAEEWTRQILDLLSQPEQARNLGLRGRQAVLAGHRSTDQVAELIKTLEKVVNKGAYQFASNRS